MDRARRIELYNRCHPEEALEPNDERNLDIDHEGDSAHPPRGFVWVDELAESIEFSNGHRAHELFTGLPGSGKSTELRRLARRLGRKPGANLLPVLIDAAEMLDTTQDIEVTDVLAAVIFGVEREISRLTTGKELEALRETWFDRFWHFLKTTEVSVPRAGSAVVGEMKTNPSLRGLVRSKINKQLGSFLSAAREHLEALDEIARSHGGREGLVVIVDSLEKLGGVPSTHDSVIASAERLFADGAPHLRLPVHALYTFPPALTLRLNAPVHFMPMIKLNDQAGVRWTPGFETARELVRRRVDDTTLVELLGSQAEDWITRVIEWSGGYPRDIVRLLQSLIPKEDLDEHLFQRVLGMAGDRITSTITSDEERIWLAQVAVEHELTFTEGQRKSAMRLLTNSVVLRYQNHSRWYDVHPAVRERAWFQAAVDTYRRRTSPPPRDE